ncbi:MAG TPA: YihY/virulence factor BrkB family protein [Nocardioidaceae bacterium]|nr:YihY/virulence factor BrkB family protein [Nocardioidaceae bacterium]
MVVEAGHAGGTRVPAWRRARHTVWRLSTATVGATLRYRVTGLAAEAAFFAILSLPPLVFALAGSIGFFVEQYAVAQIDSLRADILTIASQALTQDAVNTVVADTLDDVLRGGRIDVISIGFVLALWSGSRALNVFVDTITIMYGLAGRRGIVRTRALSFVLYVVGLLIAVVVLPLILVGPEIITELLPQQLSWLIQLYWPTVIVLSVGFIASLYHLSVPVRTSWRHDVPGAALALAMWVLGSWLLRWALQNAVGGTSIYGPLAAPIAVLLWLYLISLAVLIGAALNAAFDRVWPQSATASARLELVRRLRRAAKFERLRGAGTASELAELAARADAEEDCEPRPGARRRRQP